MKTKRPLNQLVPSLVEHVKKHYQSHVAYNAKLLDISNGNLLPYVEASMKEELNPRAFERSRQRIPPINILNKLQTKLSKVYAESPVRKCGENQIDNELMSYYESSTNINEALAYANDLLVINKYCALEPFTIDGVPNLRVLSAKDFIVYSDSSVAPNEMTVFIKFMGTITKEDSDTGLNKAQKQREAALYHAYSDDEFIIFDEEGQIYEQLDNPYGVIPFVYIRANNNELIPTPDSDNLPMATLVPKLLADLNYAVMFGCRSQIVGIDVEMDNVEFAPDSLWLLNSTQGEGKQPSLDTIKSDVDVEKVLGLINNELGLFLDSKGIKTSAVGKMTVENAASGISKMVDESDASAVNRKYRKVFKGAEKALWKLIPTLHEVWVASAEVELRKAFSSQFDVSTELIEQKVLPDRKKLLEEMKLEKELGIFNKEDALKRLYPEASEKEINQKLGKSTENEQD
tara:strand:+ start:67 stop:1443 length:1377 start_codon:yes stop_codon:yes gene_type:complete